jgi:Fe-S-cluster containining protein
MSFKKPNNMKCSQCGICCRLFLINLTKEEYKSRKYKTQFEEIEFVEDFKEAELCAANIITQKEDGSCIYLRVGMCSIHSERPLACRNFFCSNPRFKTMNKKIKDYKISIGII